MKEEKTIKKFLYAALIYAIIVSIFGIESSALAVFIQLCIAALCGIVNYRISKNMTHSILIGFLSALVLVNIFTIAYILKKLNRINHMGRNDNNYIPKKNNINEVDLVETNIRANDSYEMKVPKNKQKEKNGSSRKHKAFGFFAGVFITLLIVFIFLVSTQNRNAPVSNLNNSNQNIEAFKTNRQGENEVNDIDINIEDGNNSENEIGENPIDLNATPHDKNSVSDEKVITIGTTKEDVIKIMGTPSMIMKSINTLYYGSDSISFDNNDRVEEWSNIMGGLKVSY